MTTKKLFIVGATGPLGVFVCQEALSRGYSVRIYARNPSKLPEDVSSHAQVEIITGQLGDEEALTSAIAGCNAIVSALGPSTNLSILTMKRGTFYQPLQVMIKAARASGIKRILVLGTPSAAVDGDMPPLSIRFFIGFLKLFLNAVYSEIGALGRVLDEEAQDLDWTMYRLGMLSNGKGDTSASANVGTDGWVNATHRPSLAKWIIDQVEVENGPWSHKKPTVYSLKT